MYYKKGERSGGQAEGWRVWEKSRVKKRRELDRRCSEEMEGRKEARKEGRREEVMKEERKEM